jgi:soluble lytic murein transglycosylase-like protein
MHKTAAFRPLFLRFGKAYQIDHRLLEAIALQESGGKPAAFRYEPAKLDGSFGLMQVMGATARALAFPPDSHDAELCEPEVGILYGVKALADILDRYTADSRFAREHGEFAKLPRGPLPFPIQVALARYNGGPRGNPGDDGKSLRNNAYVMGVGAYFGAVCSEVP